PAVVHRRASQHLPQLVLGPVGVIVLERLQSLVLLRWDEDIASPTSGIHDTHLPLFPCQGFPLLFGQLDHVSLLLLGFYPTDSAPAPNPGTSRAAPASSRSRCAAVSSGNDSISLPGSASPSGNG